MSFKDRILKKPISLVTSGWQWTYAWWKWIWLRQDPPNLDDIIKNFQKTINKFSVGNLVAHVNIGLLILALLYVASGLYRVLPDEQGVVLRFGKYVNATQPGLHYHFPTPFERVLTAKVTRI